MFGSIVVILPTSFKGGELALTQGKKKIKYDYASELAEKSIDKSTEIENEVKVGWIAFYSDIEHEILPVTEGYRVTLTYVRSTTSS